jgi:hypothetical protein
VINRNQIIRQADDDGVPATTVERDYILSHVLAAIANCEQAEEIVFKGGTALRLCWFEDYRYSADLDFSLIGELDRPGALQAVAEALAVCRQALGLPALSLTDATPPRIEYTGPLGRSRRLKLDLADDELVENTARRPVFRRYGDQGECDCLAYALEETAAEKLRCVIQRLQCRDLRSSRRSCAPSGERSVTRCAASDHQIMRSWGRGRPKLERGAERAHLAKLQKGGVVISGPGSCGRLWPWQQTSTSIKSWSWPRTGASPPPS